MALQRSPFPRSIFRGFVVDAALYFAAGTLSPVSALLIDFDVDGSGAAIAKGDVIIS